MRRLLRDWPSTTRLLLIVIGLGLVLVLELIWPPSVFIIFGLLWLMVLGLAFKEDRGRAKARR